MADEIRIPGDELDRARSNLSTVQGSIDLDPVTFDFEAAVGPALAAGSVGAFESAWSDGRVQLHRQIEHARDAITKILDTFQRADDDAGRQLGPRRPTPGRGDDRPDDGARADPASGSPGSGRSPLVSHPVPVLPGRPGGSVPTVPGDPTRPLEPGLHPEPSPPFPKTPPEPGLNPLGSDRPFEQPRPPEPETPPSPPPPPPPPPPPVLPPSPAPLPAPFGPGPLVDPHPIGPPAPPDPGDDPREPAGDPDSKRHDDPGPRR